MSHSSNNRTKRSLQLSDRLKYIGDIRLCNLNDIRERYAKLCEQAIASARAQFLPSTSISPQLFVLQHVDTEKTKDESTSSGSNAKDDLRDIAALVVPNHSTTNVRNVQTGEYYCAFGHGILHDDIQKQDLYVGEWMWGFPHGVGKGHWNIQLGSDRTLISAESLVSEHSDAFDYGSVSGLYAGAWTCGVPHGTGKLRLSLGDLLRSAWICGIPHGPTAIHVSGDGLLLAVFANGRPHGCAVFLWPPGVRMYEARQYAYGRRVAAHIVSPRQVKAFAYTQPLWKNALTLWESGESEGDQHPDGALRVQGFELDNGVSEPSLELISSHKTSTDLTGSADISSKIFNTNMQIEYPPTSRLRALGLKTLPAVELDGTAVIRLLRNTSVHEIDGGKVGAEGTGVVTVNIEDTVAYVLDVLTRYNVYSVPVWDDKSKAYVAIVHVLDIFAFMLDIVNRHASKSGLRSEMPLREAIVHKKLFAEQPIKAIVDRMLGVNSMKRRDTKRNSPSLGPTSGPASPPQVPLTASSMPPVLDEVHPSKLSTRSNSPPHTNSSTQLSTNIAGTNNTRHAISLSPLARSSLTLGEHGSSGQRSTTVTTRSAPTNAANVSPTSMSNASSTVNTTTETAGTGLDPSSMFSSEFIPLPQNSPLLYACRTLCSGAHAVPVVDASGNIQRMVTVADVIRFLATRVQQLGEIAHRTVAQLGLGAHGHDPASAEAGGLVVARLHERVMDVMQQLRAAGSSAAPIVDEYGSMVTNLSISDAKTIARRGNFDALQLPLLKFFAAIDKPINTVNPSIYSRPNTSLANVLLTLAATRIHQLYYVDDRLRPVGCVRGVDILKALLAHDDESD